MIPDNELIEALEDIAENELTIVAHKQLVRIAAARLRELLDLEKLETDWPYRYNPKTSTIETKKDADARHALKKGTD